MARAYIELHDVIPNLNPSTVSAIVPELVSADELQSEALFNEIKDQIAADEAAAKQINAVFLYNITKNGKVAGTWTLDLKKPTVYKGEPNGVKADTTFTVADQDFIDLAAGKLNPQVAFMKGKLKISGNIMLAEKMRAILKQKSKL